MKKLKAAVIALVLFAPVAAHAGGTQIGTAPLLLSLGVTNIYGQFQLGNTSALVASYSTINGSYGSDTLNLSSYSLAYKSYFNEYGNGGYWEIGAGNFDVKASTSSTFTSTGNVIIPIAVAGYEWNLGSFVLGAEGGIGTGGGWGFLGVNAALQF